MELKIQDKEEITWKQLASQHKDKEGVKENELRRKLIGIMSTYDLLEHFEDTNDKEKVKPYKVSMVLLYHTIRLTYLESDKCYCF